MPYIFNSFINLSLFLAHYGIWVIAFLLSVWDKKYSRILQLMLVGAIAINILKILNPLPYNPSGHAVVSIIFSITLFRRHKYLLLPLVFFFLANLYGMVHYAYHLIPEVIAGSIIGIWITYINSNNLHLLAGLSIFAMLYGLYFDQNVYKLLVNILAYIALYQTLFHLQKH